jgi:hypothetical protein
MNIFILNESDVTKCAQQHCDKHVVKMILEHAQMLSTAVRESGIDEGYKSTHVNHPCNIWVRESLSNWNWLWNLTDELHREWQYRFNHSHNHKSWDVVSKLPSPKIKDIGLTDFAQAMPDECKSSNAQIAYRKYYKNHKQHLAQWTSRPVPQWYTK